MKIEDFNPWWKTGRISEDYDKLKERALFKEIVEYVDERQIVVLTGLRRTGKTVLLYHLVRHLVKDGINPRNIVYFNFDLAMFEVDKILEDYKNITNTDYEKEKIFVFLDEIQKLDDWQNKLKLIYDNNRNIKFFVSGSSSLFIEKRTKESLAGRSFSFHLLPLRFIEYVILKEKEDFLKKPVLYGKELERELKEYTKSGGFPELIDQKDDFKIKKYVKELVIDKIIYIDIPLVFEIEEPELLQKLLSIVSSSPGMVLDYETLANDLQRNRRTISNYLFYLEKSFLVNKLYNFSKNLLTSEKKMKRFYPTTTALANLFCTDLGKVIETLVLQNSDFRFFYRKGGKEVDFVNKKPVFPVEVKSSDSVNKNTKVNLLDFMGKFKVNKGIVITKSKEGEVLEEWFGIKKRISYVPLWKWLL